MTSLRRHRVVLFLCLSVTLASPLSSQQAGPPSDQPPKIAVINFLGQVDMNSVNALIQAVDAVYKTGTRDIRILMSSPQGDPAAGFIAYNYLKGLPVQLSTFNMGSIDPSGMLIYCAGQKRYAMPDTRFMFHTAGMTICGNAILDAAALQAQLSILSSQNEMMATVVSSAIKRNRGDIESAMKASAALTPEQARLWGLVNDIRSDFFPPGAYLVRLNPSGVPSPTTTPMFSIKT